MARYPLTKKIEEFTHHVSMLVGQQGWQGRLTASWNAKREEFSEGKQLGSQKLYIVKFRNAIKEWFGSLPVNDPRSALEEKTLAIISFPDGMLETLNRKDEQALFFLKIDGVKGVFPMLGTEQKMDGSEVSRLEVTKVSRGPQRADQFEIPAGFTKFERN